MISFSWKLDRALKNFNFWMLDFKNPPLTFSKCTFSSPSSNPNFSIQVILHLQIRKLDYKYQCKHENSKIFNAVDLQIQCGVSR